jgi:N utilization substance protein B
MSSISQRRKAREFLVQALYQWKMSDAPSADIIAEFLVEHPAKKFDVQYFQEVLCGVINHRKDLDDHIALHTNRAINELDPIELSILRLATFELIFKLEIPYRVVINEAVDQAKRFGATDGYKFVNGVVDKLAQQIRSIECRQ